MASTKLARDILKRTLKEMQVMRDEYDADHEGDGIDERFQAKLQTILTAEDPLAAAQKVKDSFQIHLLSEWAKKKIDGKPSVSMYQRKAKKARSLAKMFAKKGDSKAADAQLRRGAEFEKMAKELADPGIDNGNDANG